MERESPGGRRRSEPGRRLALVGAGMLMALALAEVLLRVFPPPISDRLFEAHDRFGWFHIPGREGWHRTHEFSTLVTLNSQGLRDVEHGYSGAEGIYRILILGDSFAEGFQVQLEETVGRRLEGMLNGRRVGSFEVINGGVSGFGTDQELIFYEEEGSRYRPDLVLLFFFQNDVQDNADDSHFRLTGGTLERLQAPPPADPGLVAAARPWVWDHFAFVRLAGTVWSRLNEALAGQARPVTREPESCDVAEARAETDHGWTLTEALLRELDRLVRSDGARLAIVHVAAVHSLGLLPLPPDCPSPRVSARLGQVAERWGIHYLDLAPAFASTFAAEPGPLYWPEDEHWNSAGHELAAKTVFAWLTEGRHQAPLPADPALRSCSR